MAITKHKSIKGTLFLKSQLTSLIISAKNGNESVKSKRQTKTSRAGLQFPVGRILRKMHGENLAKRVGPKSAVYIAAVLEFLVAEIIEIAGIVARQYKRVRITPRHLMLAIKTDHEFGP
jgi:histone H2A